MLLGFAGVGLSLRRSQRSQASLKQAAWTAWATAMP